MKNNKISIITVCRNSIDSIIYTINSIYSQNYKNIEHIIIDNNSVDGTYEILKRYKKFCKKYPIKIVRETDDGIYDAINKGIKVSSGELICILNSDDIFHSNKSLSEINRQINLHPNVSIYFFDLIYFKGTDFKKIVRYYPCSGFSPWMIKFGIIPPHPASIVKKKVYEKNGLYKKNMRIAGDFELFLRYIFKLKLSYKTFNILTVRMRIGGASGKNIFSYITTLKENYISFKMNKMNPNIFYLLCKLPSKLMQFFIFNEKNLNKNYYKIKLHIQNHKPKKIIKLIHDIKPIINKNFVLSGLNLAFCGYYSNKNIHLYKELYHWPDGIFSKVFKTNLKKIPGREILHNIKIPNTIKSIKVVGQLSHKSKNYLKKRFRLNVSNIKLPYANVSELSKYLPKKIDKNTLILITLPTPKQEILAEIMKVRFKNFKIICIGASLAMCSGEEKIVPSFLEKINLEFLWRLRNDTRRRLVRLLQTFYYCYTGLNKNIFKEIEIKEI